MSVTVYFFKLLYFSVEGNSDMKLFWLGFGVGSNLSNQLVRTKCIGT